MDYAICITLGQILISVIILCMLGMIGLTAWFFMAHDVTARKKCKKVKTCGNSDCLTCKDKK